jgi:hypothetical protein
MNFKEALKILTEKKENTHVRDIIITEKMIRDELKKNHDFYEKLNNL